MSIADKTYEHDFHLRQLLRQQKQKSFYQQSNAVFRKYYHYRHTQAYGARLNTQNRLALLQKKNLEKAKQMTTSLTITQLKRRDKLDIVAEIMDISKTGALKTQIMYKANLSFAQLTLYLNLLTQNNLLSKMPHDGKEIYVATQKGKDFLEKHQQVKDLLQEHVELSIQPKGLFKTAQ